jgi:DNA uptake protein ComE-like DNA-binding protein
MPTGVPNHQESGLFVSKWISLVVGLALLAGPAQSKEEAKAQPAPSAVAQAKPSAKTQKKLVNLNTASAKELKGLPGGSDEEAARIIAGRPYNSKAFLVTNNVISARRYEELRALVVAGEATKPAARARSSSTK